MAETSIEWTDATWNPVAGCAILSPGCTNCYAMRMAARLDAMGQAKYRGLTRRSGGRAVWKGHIRCDEGSLEIPTAWRKPRRVFVNSMSDLFHPDVPATFVARVWEVMEQCSRHTFQILTKRPDRMRQLAAEFPLLSNVWLGTSVESADYLFRLDALRDTPAAVRFVSFEPLLGSVAVANLHGLHWAIVGGESGPRARTMEQRWVEEIAESCRSFGVAFFFKQWGGPRPKSGGRELYGREWSQFPVSTPPCAAAAG